MLSLLIILFVFLVCLVFLAPFLWTLKEREPTPFFQQYKKNVCHVLVGIKKDIYENIEVILTFIAVFLTFIILKKCGAI